MSIAIDGTMSTAWFVLTTHLCGGWEVTSLGHQRKTGRVRFPANMEVLQTSGARRAPQGAASPDEAQEPVEHESNFTLLFRPRVWLAEG